MLGHVDDWLAELFAAQARALAALARVADVDDQIDRYRASIDAKGDPAVIGPWIAQAKKVAAQAEVRAATGRRQMTRNEIEAVVSALGALAWVVQTAEPADKADMYANFRLTLTCQPRRS